MAELRMFRAAGQIPQASGAAAAALEARAAAWGLPVRRADDGLALSLWGGELRLTLMGRALRVEIAAPEDRLVGVLREALSEIMAEAGLEVAWDRLDVGALAPGLSLMRVDRVAPAGPNFIRLRLRGADAGRFATGGLHVRLLLPPAGRAAVWPRVAASGRAVWPVGADALHRPVYTIAAQQDDWLEILIFRHADSPTCDWAASGPIGATVGVMGPGGGGRPDGALHLFGDQTALPAIGRMLAMAPGRAVLRCAPADLEVLAGLCDIRRSDIRLSDDLLGALADVPPGHVWFAAGGEEARAARRLLKGRGGVTAAAYW